MKPKNIIATTVKIPDKMYDEFKILGIKNRTTLQSLVEKCLYLYVNQDSFRTVLNDFKIPTLSTTGSFTLS